MAGYLSGTIAVVALWDPRQPTLVGSLDGLDRPVAIALDARGRRAFVALDRGDPLAIIGLESPSSPTMAAVLRDVRLKGVSAVAYQPGAPLALIFAQPGKGPSFSLVDVSISQQPTMMGSVTGIDSPSGLAYGATSLALVTSRSTGSVHVVNVSIPAAPVAVARLSLPAFMGAAGVAYDADGERAIVLARSARMLTLIDVYSWVGPGSILEGNTSANSSDAAGAPTSGPVEAPRTRRTWLVQQAQDQLYQEAVVQPTGSGIDQAEQPEISQIRRLVAESGYAAAHLQQLASEQGVSSAGRRVSDMPAHDDGIENLTVP